LIDIYTFDIPNNLIQLRSYLSTQVPTIPKKVLPANVPKHPVENLVTDKRSVHPIQTENQINNLKRKLEQAKAMGAIQIPANAKGKRFKFGKGPCSGCQSLYHDFEHCFDNPNASAETLKKAAESKDKKRKANHVEVTTVGPQADPSLSVMNSSSSDSGNNSSDIL
jgi:hypothetical protein